MTNLIFDGSRRGTLDGARARLDTAELRQRTTLLDVALDVEEAWLGLQGAQWTRDAVEDLIRQADYQHRLAALDTAATTKAMAALLEAAEEAVALAEADYKAGIGTIGEVLAAQAGRANARLGLLQARLDRLLSISRLQRAVGRVLSTETTTGVGAISLVVAGIGILAVMLMSVRERRWEIGLRRAVGARREDIMVQFLSEAALLSFFGALVGILAGGGIVHLTNHMGWARADFSTDAAMLSTGVSVAIGLVFGIHPARRAAALEPITALRTRE